MVYNFYWNDSMAGGTIMKKLLIVIDMQNDFITGPLGSPEAQAIVPYVAEKIREAVAHSDEVVFTQDTHHPTYLDSQEGKHLPVIHCVEGTPGWEIHPSLQPFVNKVFVKPGFGSTELLEYVKSGGYDRVELIGLCTDICVVTNALMLKGALPELPIRVDSAGCAGVTPKSHQAAIDTMKMCQIEV
jgi:nicotinamidase/pyrazinamidase